MPGMPRMTLGRGKCNKPDIEGDDIWLVLVLFGTLFHRVRPYARQILQVGKNIERLNLIAFKRLDANVVQILADTLPWPAFFQRQPQDLPLPWAQAIDRRRKLCAREQPLIAIGAHDHQCRFGLRARNRPQKFADELARMRALLPVGGGHIPQFAVHIALWHVARPLGVGQLWSAVAGLSMACLAGPPWLSIPLAIAIHHRHRRPPSLLSLLSLLSLPFTTEFIMVITQDAAHTERAGCILFRV